MKNRCSGRSLFAAGSLLMLGACLRSAAGQLLGPEFQVNTYTTNDQGFPAVAADSSGKFVVVWGGAGQNDNVGVFGQRFSSTGSKLGSEFQVNTYTTQDQQFPAVAATGLGSFVVVWNSRYQDGSSWGAFGQRFNSAGSKVGSEFRVNTYTTGSQDDLTVAADGLGNFVVAWMSGAEDGSLRGIFGQRYNSAGSPVGSEFQVNTYTTGEQMFPAVAADGSGNFVAVWLSSSQDGSYSGAFGQRFNSAGSKVGSEFLVNSYTTNDQRSPAVSADSAGNIVVTWESSTQDGSNFGVFGQRFNWAGARVGAEFQVNAYTTGAQWFPAVAADRLGNFVVVWDSYLQDGSDTGVFGQRFSSVGGELEGEFRVNAYTTGNQRSRTVAAGESGNFVVAWTSAGQDGSSTGVFARRLTTSIFLDGFDLGDACAWSAAVGGGC